MDTEEKKALIEANNKSFIDLFNSLEENLNVCQRNVERAIIRGDEFCILNFADGFYRDTINVTLAPDIANSLKSIRLKESLGRIKVYETESNKGILIYWGPTCRKYSNLKEL